MSTHKVRFYGEIKKIIHKLSPNSLLICFNDDLHRQYLFLFNVNFHGGLALRFKQAWQGHAARFCRNRSTKLRKEFSLDFFHWTK